MSDNKRNASTFAAMEASSGATMSKKRKTNIGSCQLQLRSSDVQLRSSHLQDTTVSPATSVSSAGMVVSGECCAGRFPLSCSSISSTIVENVDAVKDSTPALDLEASVFETVDSTYSNFKLFSKQRFSLSELSADSEETTVFPVKSSTAAGERGKFPTMPPKEEIEEFFAEAEKYEQKRFAEKYNYDIVKDMPLQGKYQWVRLI